MAGLLRDTTDRLQSVITGDYCTGCGACAALAPDSYFMKWDGEVYHPSSLPDAEGGSEAADVCPFASDVDESDIAREWFADTPEFRIELGRYRSTWVGHVVGAGRDRGSSGGLTNWLASHLLATGEIDALVHVGTFEEGGEDKPILGYRVSRTVEEINRHSKSQYYPIEISRVMAEIRATPGRYAIVTIPCIAKAVRLLQKQDSVLRSRIVHVLGIVCGHLKTAGFAESLAWQVGVPPSALKMVDFRVKLKDEAANAYGFSASGTTEDGIAVSGQEAMPLLVGADWGAGLFRLNACDYCDDVFAETADVVFGDAWLPEFVSDYRGTNVVVIRSATIDHLFGQAAIEGEISVSPLSDDRVVESQSSGLRHRRSGLQYRLWLKEAAGEWHPQKRLAARRDHIDGHQKSVFRERMSLSKLSTERFRLAKKTNDLRGYLDEVSRAQNKYKGIMRGTIFYRILQKAKCLLKIV